MQVPIQHIAADFLSQAAVSIAVKREDVLHPLVSGNKFRKLKYNVLEAKKLGHDTLLTFGGAFSNHILATAASGKENGLKSVGVIRGEELQLSWKNNPTLAKAAQLGMQFHFVDRGAYRN